MSFFLTILSFLGRYLVILELKKITKIWRKHRKSQENFFSDFCTKSVRNYPTEQTFAFFYMGIWKKQDFARVKAILSKKFKVVTNLKWLKSVWVWVLGGFDGIFQFFLDFEVHFLENRFPNLFQKTTRVFASASICFIN